MTASGSLPAIPVTATSSVCCAASSWHPLCSGATIRCWSCSRLRVCYRSRRPETSEVERREVELVGPLRRRERDREILDRESRRIEHRDVVARLTALRG